jgi:hypothetical protein
LFVISFIAPWKFEISWFCFLRATGFVSPNNRSARFVEATIIKPRAKVPNDFGKYPREGFSELFRSSRRSRMRKQRDKIRLLPISVSGTVTLFVKEVGRGRANVTGKLTDWWC